MAITMMDVRSWLDPEEPDYAGAKKKLGAAAMPYLMELVQGADLALASKATYLASMIKSEQTPQVIQIAAESNEPLLRVAAASGMRNLPSRQAAKVLESLKDDQDVGVRKVMLKSAGHFRSREIAAKLKLMSKSDPEESIRDLAATTAAEMRKPKEES